jgi:hypothetical protein
MSFAVSFPRFLKNSVSSDKLRLWNLALRLDFSSLNGALISSRRYALQLLEFRELLAHLGRVVRVRR